MIQKTWKNIRSILPSVLLMLTAGCFTACSSEEEPGGDVAPQKQRAFVFGVGISEMEQASNRAGSKLEDLGIRQFHVWGYKNMSYDAAALSYGDYQQVFPGYTVEYNEGDGASSSGDGDWNYVGNYGGREQSVKFWDFSAKAYRFMATTGNFEDLSHSISADPLTGELSAKTVARVSPENNVYFSDLWLSGNPQDFGKTVQLKFRCPFSKVRFMFVDEQSLPLTFDSEVVAHVTRESIAFRPTELAVRELGYGGSVAQEYPITGTASEEKFFVQEIHESHDALTIPYEEQTDPSKFAFVQTMDNNAHWYLLLPTMAGQESRFVLSLDYDGVERRAYVPETYMNWEINHEYTYVFKLTPQELVFQPQLSVFKEWQSGYVPDTPVEW